MFVHWILSGSGILPFTFSAISWLIGKALSPDKVITDIIIIIMVMVITLRVPRDVGDKVSNQRHQQGRGCCCLRCCCWCWDLRSLISFTRHNRPKEILITLQPVPDFVLVIFCKTDNDSIIFPLPSCSFCYRRKDCSEWAGCPWRISPPDVRSPGGWPLTSPWSPSSTPGSPGWPPLSPSSLRSLGHLIIIITDSVFWR